MICILLFFASRMLHKEWETPSPRCAVLLHGREWPCPGFLATTQGLTKIPGTDTLLVIGLDIKYVLAGSYATGVIITGTGGLLLGLHVKYCVLISGTD